MTAVRALTIIFSMSSDLALVSIALAYAGFLAMQEKRSALKIKIARILFAVSIGLIGLASILLGIWGTGYYDFDYYGLEHYDSIFGGLYRGILGLISGVVFVAAAIGILFKRKARLASLSLAAMVAINLLLLHIPRFAESFWSTRDVLFHLVLLAGVLTWAGILGGFKAENSSKNLKSTGSRNPEQA